MKTQSVEPLTPDERAKIQSRVSCDGEAFVMRRPDGKLAFIDPDRLMNLRLSQRGLRGSERDYRRYRRSTVLTMYHNLFGWRRFFIRNWWKLKLHNRRGGQ